MPPSLLTRPDGLHAERRQPRVFRVGLVAAAVTVVHRPGRIREIVVAHVRQREHTCSRVVKLIDGCRVGAEAPCVLEAENHRQVRRFRARERPHPPI